MGGSITLFVCVYLSLTAISCGDPGTPANGFVTGSSYTANSTVYYTCGSGYALEGPNARVCGTDGTWSGVSPSCSSKSDIKLSRLV